MIARRTHITIILYTKGLAPHDPYNPCGDRTGVVKRANACQVNLCFNAKHLHVRDARPHEWNVEGRQRVRQEILTPELVLARHPRFEQKHAVF